MGLDIYLHKYEDKTAYDSWTKDVEEYQEKLEQKYVIGKYDDGSESG